MKSAAKKPAAKGWWYVLLLAPVVAMVWVPAYNRLEPVWFGFPFFYWYQLLWIPLGAVLLGVVYSATRRR